MLMIFIDATNPDSDTRKHWIELAKKFAIPIRCIYLTAPPHICQHNDAVRAFGGDIVCIGPSLFFFLPIPILFMSSYKNPIGGTPALFRLRPNMKNRDSRVHCDGQMNPENRKILPRLAFTGYASRFKEPTLDEGFLDITKLEFKVRMQLPASLSDRKEGVLASGGCS